MKEEKNSVKKISQMSIVSVEKFISTRNITKADLSLAKKDKAGHLMLLKGKLHMQDTVSNWINVHL